MSTSDHEDGGPHGQTSIVAPASQQEQEENNDPHTPLLPVDSMPVPMPVVSAPSEPVPLPLETAHDLLEAYDCAKLNMNWSKVTSSVMVHPDWLTKIPEGRRWAILHQVVFSGNVMHLNEVLAHQITNPAFRLLSKTVEGKTVREVAQERQNANPHMMRRIERLVAVDQLLNNAKEGKWALCKNLIRQQPDVVNEKPPYRRFYLAHHLAYMGLLDEFREFSTICQFKLDLIADNKTVNMVARENNHIEFAEHVEEIHPELVTLREQMMAAAEAGGQATAAAAAPPQARPHHPHHYSQGFYDDPGIMILSVQATNSGNMFLSNGGGHHSSFHHNYHHDPWVMTHSLLQNSNASNTMHSLEDTASASAHTPQQQQKKKPKDNAPPMPPMSEEEQAAYEKTVNENIQLMSQQNLINCITCCISKQILRDPVVAADGFTYEREEILKWFEHSNRSPMTNQELEDQELKPNHAIKQILQALTEANKDKKGPTSSSSSGAAAEGGGSSGNKKEGHGDHK